MMIINDLMNSYGFWPILLGIWDMICFVIKTMLSGKDLVSEYQITCKNNLDETLAKSESGREILALMKDTAS